ncbi:hypothetical protein RFI_26173, partial [Reticulomyxa filosa]
MTSQETGTTTTATATATTRSISTKSGAKEHKLGGVVSTSIWNDGNSVKDLSKKFDAKSGSEHASINHRLKGDDAFVVAGDQVFEANDKSDYYSKLPLSPRQRVKSRAKNYESGSGSGRADRFVHFSITESSSDVLPGTDLDERELSPNSKPSHTPNQDEPSFPNQNDKSRRRRYVKGSLLRESRSSTHHTTDWTEPVSFVSWKNTMKALLEEQNRQKPLPDKDRALFEEVLKDDKKLTTIFFNLTDGNQFMTMQHIMFIRTLRQSTHTKKKKKKNIYTYMCTYIHICVHIYTYTYLKWICIMLDIERHPTTDAEAAVADQDESRGLDARGRANARPRP